MKAQVISTPPKEAHIAPCGLFCSECGKFKRDKCEGCQIQAGFKQCSIRICVIEKGIKTCAECQEFKAPRDYKECKKVNNFIAKVISLITGSNRPAALALLRDEGIESYLVEKRRANKM